MAAKALDKNTAWELVLDAVNRSNVTLSLPGSDKPALDIGQNGEWELRLPAELDARTLLSVFLPLCCTVAEG